MPAIFFALSGSGVTPTVAEVRGCRSARFGLWRYGLTGNIDITLIMACTPRKGEKVSAVATDNSTAVADVLREAAEDREDGKTVTRVWTRTPEQDRMVADYLELIFDQYADADPRLYELLTDEEIVGTPEMVEMLGYTRGTRAFQLYTKARRLAAADQVPHPSAVPEADAFAGKRGPRDIRGAMVGRVRHWMLQSGRGRWDPIAGKIVPQTGINHGGAPQQRTS